MNCRCDTKQVDYGDNPYITNVKNMAIQNSNYRTTIWTGNYLQSTLMCIPPCEDIGLEVHPNTDQFIRIEEGRAVAKLGKCQNMLDIQKDMFEGDVVFVPAGMWHNIINVTRRPLKLSVIYAPPNHLKGTIHHTKEEAEREDY